MRYVVVAVLTVFLVCGVAATGDAADPSWLDPWRQATVALGTVKKAKMTRQGKESVTDVFVVVGTGVLFGTADKKPPLLVTAKHVFSDPSKNWNPESLRLRFAWFEDRAVEDYLGIEIALRKDGKPLWTGHPTADLAGMALVVSKTAAGRDTVEPVPQETLRQRLTFTREPQL
jgi:hypothetical protein